MGLWGPSMFSMVAYCVFNSYMEHVSLMEVMSPLILYFIIGTYIATISGYEHPKLVLRRLNMHLSSEVRQNELHAIFAFRAHTPEGHAVNQIATIADVLFKNKFQWWTQVAAALAGTLHALTPVFHRMVIEARSPDQCSADSLILKQLLWWAAGGSSMVHLMVSVPAAAISGFLCYRLISITGACIYHDLSFYYKLVLFRATTQSEPFLRYRARWIRAQKRMAKFYGRREFLQFLSLAKHDDLLLWCRIRALLMESYAGFQSKQHDIMVTYLLLYTISFTIYIFFFQISGKDNSLSVFDIRARLDVFVFSLLLIAIINLKLNIHALRKSDISLLHKEYYNVSMSLSCGHAAAQQQFTQFTGAGMGMGMGTPGTGALRYAHPYAASAHGGAHLNMHHNMHHGAPGGVAGLHAHTNPETCTPSAGNVSGSSLRRTGSSSRFQASLVRRQVI